MKPLVAIVGRPNVGKSMLFNKLCGQRLSIVEDTPGVTRDRLYAQCEWRNRTFDIVDTGGIEPGTDDQILDAALLGAIYAAVVGSHLEAENPVITYAIICAVGALISMVGDLAASAIKRNHNIKDYGTLIPGHGGIMDRFDSVIFTAPVIYYLSMFMMR